MIARIWHGWTTFENEVGYEKLLKEEIFAEIVHKNIKGFKKISLLKSRGEHEVAFITIMIFETLESVIEFAGENYQNAYVPQKARALLSRFSKVSDHYEIADERIVK